MPSATIKRTIAKKAVNPPMMNTNSPIQKSISIPPQCEQEDGSRADHQHLERESDHQPTPG